MIDLSQIPTPQLREIRKILEVGNLAKAEVDVDTEESAQDQLCHKSPPKGYPKNKSDYGDPACYRYPLNTKARCLAAWRYVHHADNKAILGKKFKSIESKIRSYAKSHYSLDLKVGESDEFDWSQAFVEYYDGETMGERCETIVLEPVSEGAEIMEKDELEKKVDTLEKENQTLRDDKDALASEKADLETKAAQVDDLTKELSDLREELDSLREFKRTTEEAAEKAERIKNIKAQLEEAEIEANLEDEAEAKYWLDMSEEALKQTISKMVTLKKGASASASVEVPNVTNNGEEEEANPVETVRQGLKELKNKKGE